MRSDHGDRHPFSDEEHQPTCTQEANIHRIDSAWKKLGNKEGGVNAAGELGGIYADINHPDRKVLFKQDPIIAKNIAEIIAGKIMRLINPDAPELFAEVWAAYANDKTGMDETGENIYVASVIFPDYIALYKDAYNAHNFLDRYSKSDKNDLRSVPRPQARPGYFTYDTIINQMILSYRYEEIYKLFLTADFVDDPDVHSENIGVIPKKSHGENENNPVIINCEDGKEKVYDKVQPVRIDYGGALGDRRRKLDDKLHLFDMFRYVSSKGEKGPPNYFRTYSREIFRRFEFLQELIKLSCFPPLVLARGINKIVIEVAAYYGTKPLLEFASWIGVTDYLKNQKKMVLDQDTNWEDLTLYISIFLRNMLSGRLKAAEIRAVSIATELNVGLDEYYWMKEQETKKFRRFFNLTDTCQKNEKPKIGNFSCHLISLFNVIIHNTDGALRFDNEIMTLLNIASIGISHFTKSAWRESPLLTFLSSDNRKEKATALMAEEIFNNVYCTEDIKLMSLCAILAYNNKLRGLRSCVINEFKLHLGKKAFHLNEVIKTLLVRKYDYDITLLKDKIANLSALALLSELKIHILDHLTPIVRDDESFILRKF